MTGRLTSLSIVALLALGSCAGGDGARVSDMNADGQAAERVLLPTSDSGLQVRQWRVADDPADPNRIAAVLMKYASADGMGTMNSMVAVDHARLAQNGFRLISLAADSLPALREELGGTSRDVEGWYGQAYEWRTVAERTLESAARAMAIDGRVRTVSGGRLRIVVRGWTTPMEDGPYIYVEAVPEHDRTRSTRLAQVLGRRAFVGDRFPGAGVELMMTPGSAWVLTTGAPGEVWTDEESAVEAGGDNDSSPGPSVEPPPTIGSMLLRRETRSLSQRDLLVFVPLIPASLVPPPLAHGAGADTMGISTPDESPRRSGL